MKKTIILAAIFTLFSAQSFAINLDKLADAVGAAAQQSDQKSGSKKPFDIVGNIEEKINKVTDRIEGRIEKYEKKFDAYEQKIDKVEKATDRALATLESFNQSEIQKYLTLAKYALSAFVLLIALSFLMLVIIFINSIKTKKLLEKLAR